MNANSQVLEVNVEQNQIEEVVLALFHTILFHRASGKFRYQQDDSYHIEELGTDDVKCDSFNLTYVRCSSRELDSNLRSQVARFVDKMKTAGFSTTTGQVALEFYEKKKKNWLFTSGSIPWEVWNVRLTVSRPDVEDTASSREGVSGAMTNLLWRIMQSVHLHDYAPPNPTHLDLDTVYETGYSDVQPYLFKVNYTVTPVNPSVTSTMTRLLRDMAIP